MRNSPGKPYEFHRPPYRTTVLRSPDRRSLREIAGA
ncbi:hypothetical protein GWR55_10250 [Edaphobacter sp. 12200R-103]|nr:hypothetical protein GWR55_10250 [Edaphobacter sp. 12200R-103]